MSPLTSSDIHPRLAAVNKEQDANREQDEQSGTVRIFGLNDDLIEVEGFVAGCDEYNVSDGTFMLIGDSAQVRVRCQFGANGLWSLGASQAVEGAEILPVTIEGGSSTYSPTLIASGVKLVVREVSS